MSVYSRRFILKSGSGLTEYTVPAASTAVLKCLMAASTHTAAANANVTINGVVVLALSIPANIGGSFGDMHLAVAAGEKLGLYFPQATMWGTLSGFLLTEAGAAAQWPAGDVITESPDWKPFEPVME